MKRKTFFQVFGAVILGLALLVMFTKWPNWNEEHLKMKLGPTFEKFKGITQEKYPNKAEREAAFAKVLVEKDQIVDANTWTFTSCEAKFIARNPGTIYRINVQRISCSWSGDGNNPRSPNAY